MAYKYCENCGDPLEAPTLQTFVDMEYGKTCDCGEDLPYTKLDMLELLVEMSEEIERLKSLTTP